MSLKGVIGFFVRMIGDQKKTPIYLRKERISESS